MHPTWAAGQGCCSGISNTIIDFEVSQCMSTVWSICFLCGININKLTWQFDIFFPRTLISSLKDWFYSFKRQRSVWKIISPSFLIHADTLRQFHLHCMDNTRTAFAHVLDMCDTIVHLYKKPLHIYCFSMACKRCIIQNCCGINWIIYKKMRLSNTWASQVENNLI